MPRKLFGELLKHSLYAHSPHFLLRFKHEERAHFGVSVSKKISKSAVVRNTIRRRVYGVLSGLHGGKKGLFLFIAKPGADKQKGENLALEIKELLSKVS